MKSYILFNQSNDKLKSMISKINESCLFNKNLSGEFTCLVILFSHLQNYFVKNHYDCILEYSEDDLKKILAFMIDNLYVDFGNQVSQQFVEVRMDTNCAPLLANIFLYLYGVKLI